LRTKISFLFTSYNFIRFQEAEEEVALGEEEVVVEGVVIVMTPLRTPLQEVVLP
jgi:hypothetical protein